VVIIGGGWCSGPACDGRAAKAEPGADAGPAAPQAPPCSDTAELGSNDHLVHALMMS
jgi:hypothetical protein